MLQATIKASVFKIIPGVSAGTPPLGSTLLSIADSVVGAPARVGVEFVRRLKWLNTIASPKMIARSTPLNAFTRETLS